MRTSISASAPVYVRMRAHTHVHVYINNIIILGDLCAWALGRESPISDVPPYRLCVCRVTMVREYRDLRWWNRRLCGCTFVHVDARSRASPGLIKYILEEMGPRAPRGSWYFLAGTRVENAEARRGPRTIARILFIFFYYFLFFFVLFFISFREKWAGVEQRGCGGSV